MFYSCFLTCRVIQPGLGFLGDVFLGCGSRQNFGASRIFIQFWFGQLQSGEFWRNWSMLILANILIHLPQSGHNTVHESYIVLHVAAQLTLFPNEHDRSLSHRSYITSPMTSDEWSNPLCRSSDEDNPKKCGKLLKRAKRRRAKSSGVNRLTRTTLIIVYLRRRRKEYLNLVVGYVGHRDKRRKVFAWDSPSSEYGNKAAILIQSCLNLQRIILVFWQHRSNWDANKVDLIWIVV